MNKLVYYNDVEHFPCEVLRKNIRLGLLPEGHVDERDIQQVHAADLLQYRHIHLFAGIGCFPLGLLRANYPFSLRTLTAGFPCQDISEAGRQEGITRGQKSSLWKEIVRLLQECREAGVIFDYILIENVRNLLSGGDWQEEKTQEQQEAEAQHEYTALRSTDSRAVDETTDESVFTTWMGVVLAELAGCGYDAEWTVLSASDFGAPHQRKRVFIVAYPNQVRESEQKITFADGQCSEIEPASVCQWEDTTDLANTSSSGQQECNITPIASRTGHVPWRNLPPANRLVESSTSRRERQHQATRGESGAQSFTVQSGTGQPQSVLGGNVDGAPDWLDRYRWPARPGEQQHDWEPPRTIRGKDRIARLQALGNAIVVPCVEYIARQIIAYEEAKK